MFSGSITALVTPFTDNGSVDYPALDRLLDYQLENGTDGLAVIGTTGESATMNREEIIAVMNRAISRNLGCARTVVKEDIRVSVCRIHSPPDDPSVIVYFGMIVHIIVVRNWEYNVVSTRSRKKREHNGC